MDESINFQSTCVSATIRGRTRAMTRRRRAGPQCARRASTVRPYSARTTAPARRRQATPTMAGTSVTVQLASLDLTATLVSFDRFFITYMYVNVVDVTHGQFTHTFTRIHLATFYQRDVHV